MLDLGAALDVAIAAAERAGAILTEHFGTPLDVHTKSSPRDLVTEVDGLAQEMIIETILKTFPDHGFITEETVGAKHAAPLQKNRNAAYQWIIDPLDGTTNFIHGKREFATMIALAERREGGLEFLLGVIHAPLLGQRFSGAKGLGAFANDRSITLRKTKDMVDAITSTNIAARAREFPDGTLATPILPCGSIHNYGCAAMEMGAILLGENDGVFYDGVGLWDIAAPCAILAEAGGKYHYELREAGDVRSGVRCVASTPPIFQELCMFLFRDARR